MKKLSLLLLFLCLTATSATAAMVKRPYMLYPGNNTQMTVLWQVSSTQTCTLEWGTTTSYGSSTTTSEYGTDHQHKHNITGLTPGQKYYYRLDDGSYYTGSFVAAPSDSATGVKLFVYADTRNNPGTHNSVNGRMITEYTSDPDYQSITLFPGDWVDKGRTESQWTDQWFTTSRSNMVEFRANVPINGCRGNHENNIGSSDDGDLFLKYYPYPYASNHYWSFDYGPVHVAVLDQYTSYGSGSTQYNWLVNDLSSSTKKWKFVIYHAPGWSAGDHSVSSTVRNALQPLFETYGVDIVFCGHNHNYARCEVNGVVHITTGGGGAPLDNINMNFNEDGGNIITASKENHFCMVEIDENYLYLDAVKTNGTTIDSLTIFKSPPDINTPEPDPMTWETPPYAARSSMISMEATTATDPSGTEYFFTCAAGTGHNSGWQDSTIYTDAGLNPLTQYTYIVTARDKSPAQNQTVSSTAESATTLEVRADKGYIVQSGRLQVYGTVMDIPIHAVSDMSRAFVLLSKGTGYLNDSDQNANIVQLRGYLQATDNIRIERDASAFYNSGVSYQVIECLDEEFTVHRGQTSMTSAETSKTVSIGATVNPDNCLAYVTADNDSASKTTYHQAMLSAYLSSTTEVTLERYSAGTTSPNINWVVVEFDPTKIADIQSGNVNVDAHSFSAPQTVTIDPIDTDTSILIYQACPDSSGLSQTAVAGNINSSTQIKFYKHLVSASFSDVQWYVIDFGTGATAQRGVVDESADTTWSIVNVPISSVDVTGTMNFHNITCNGTGTAFPRAMATAHFSSDTNLRIQRNRDGQGSYVEWQVLELPYEQGPPDTNAPTPDPLTWATAPYHTGSTSIAMLATTAADPSGVEYYFTCTAGGGHNSGWQDSNYYEDTGLTPYTQYTYTAKARDKTVAQNETAPSTAQDATTKFPGDIDDDTDVDFDDFTYLSDQWRQTPATPSADIAPATGDNFVDFRDLAAIVSDWLAGTE